MNHEEKIIIMRSIDNNFFSSSNYFFKSSKFNLDFSGMKFYSILVTQTTKFQNKWNFNLKKGNWIIGIF